MSRARLLPPTSHLVELVDQGLTHAQIAERICATGVKVSRSSVSSALSRAGVSSQRERYRDFLPWRLNPAHDDAFVTRQLRTLARLERGQQVSDTDRGKAERFLARLRAAGCVVTYSFDSGYSLIPGKFDTNPTLAR